MKGRFGIVGRSAAALGIALTMLVAAGTGAGAAAKVSLTNYTASALSQTLDLTLNIPALGKTGYVREVISSANALGQWDKATGKIIGRGTARVLDGTVLSTKTTSAVVNKATSGQRTASDSVAPSIDVAGLLHVGVGETSSKALRAVNGATSESHSKLLSIVAKLDLVNQATGGLVQTLEDTLNGSDSNPNGGVIDQINDALANVTGVDDTISEPQLVGTNVDLLNIGVMTADSYTGMSSTGRWAKAFNELVGVKALGGFIDIGLIRVEARGELNNLGQWVQKGSYATTEIAHVNVGGKLLNLSNGTLTVAGKTFSIPTDALNQLSSLVNGIAGLKIEALNNTVQHSAGHVFAQANSLRIKLAPANLFELTVQAPLAQASVDNGTQKVLGRRLTRTGLADTSFLVLGPVLLGAAVLVRRFSLSR
jgi:hypothetical protein